MFSSLEERTIEHINVTKMLINVHAETAERHEAGLRQKIKIYNVSSCVTRLYAIYENFIETAISDYLDYLPDLVKFSSLHESFKKEYRLGISYLLSKVDQGRYSHLTHENIINWYYEALNDKETYRFVNEALTRHEQNLRLNIVDNLFSKIQLRDLKNWMAIHPEIRKIYPDEGSVFEQLESDVKDFVQLRNDASHGIMDSLEGDGNLSHLCDLVSAVVKAIASFLHKSILSVMADNGKAKKLGVVTESFGQNGAFVAKVDSGVTVKKGEEIHFVDSNNCYARLIESIMINDELVDQAVADKDNFEVGIKCKNRIRKNSKLYKFV